MSARRASCSSPIRLNLRSEGEVVARVALQDDVAAVVRYVVDRLPGKDVTVLERSLSTTVRDGALVVATRAGEVVGYGRAERREPYDAEDPAPPGMYLIGVLVDEGLRRRGLGRELTRLRLAVIGHDHGVVRCFVNAGNEASLAMHRGLGFVEEDRAASYLGVAFDGGVGVLLRWER